MSSAGGTLTEPRTLALFNHVRAGSGYPNLVGGRMLEEKGATETGRVDVERDVILAHDRPDVENDAVDRGGELLT